MASHTQRFCAMKQTPKCALFSTILCALLMTTSCGSRTTTYTTPEGLKITPEAVETNATAQMLDIRFWKFGLDVPKQGQGFNCTLEVCRNGRTLQTIGGGGLVPMKSDKNTHTEMEVALYPLAGSITEPGKIKTSCIAGGAGGFTFRKNPFAGAGGTFAGDPILLPDGGLELFSAGKTPTWPPAPDNLVLVCKFTIMPPMRQK